ncbi:hypothetical protein L6452_14758 [Arctium lappa]|uniref:Uncharacterized protein n=1 Tax=Arctium lappa TaxID=4217 RepID=A0ACB9CM13_ARCLA|nr:hypothetical protein L6452_14758 [Arctium lappa]
MTLDKCEMACTRDCSCTAYAQLNIRNGGSGCLLWFDELMDIREYDEKQEIYIRMAASELAEKTQLQQEEILIVKGRDSIGSITAAELSWGNEDHIRALDPPFDYIIGTDIVYAEHLLEPLL